MLLENVEENKIYRNKKGHLVLLNGKHICYIDIRRDAIVYVTKKSLRGDDWEVLSVQEEKKPEPVVEEEIVEGGLGFLSPESLELLDKELAKKTRGRPRKSS
jgi:hypothetical protein